MPTAFVGRKHELELLLGELEHLRESGQGGFIWMRGRRRVGKSRLVQEFIEASKLPYVFYQAPRRTSADALERFRKALAASSLPVAETVRIGASFDSWPAALRLAQQGATRERPVIVVIDELPYLVEADAGTAADIQEAWDRELQHRPVLLVCIGSDMRMMRALTEYPAELYGRPTREMVVQPFSPRDLAVLSGADGAQAFDRFLIVGGLPMLARSWAPSSTRRQFLGRELLDPASPLVVDGLRILDAEFPAELQAREVLAAIGHGERAFTEIGRRSGVGNEASLSTVLKSLVSKGMVESALPYAAPPGLKSRRYMISDPYLRFWLRFIGPGIDEIDRGRGDLVLERVERDWTSFRGRAIEPVVRRSLERLLPSERFGDARYVGAYWTRTNVPEVDLVGAADPKPTAVSFVGSIKWRENALFTRPDAQELIEQRSRVPGAAGARLVGVSRRGFVTDAGLDVELTPDELLRAWPEP
ncbi:MAG TPA: ATP-binding protein [Solirubrobacteraceae bacterium]|jgi:AAA+ ATPase superfamily predicted ATPase|nr:ATP-binding protein [Solirubrobacteraceae bacterium]